MKFYPDEAQCLDAAPSYTWMVVCGYGNGHLEGNVTKLDGMVRDFSRNFFLPTTSSGKWK